MTKDEGLNEAQVQKRGRYGRGGRPKISDDLRRVNRFSVYLSNDELAQIKIAALGEHNQNLGRQESAIQIADFIRKSALNQPIEFNRSIPPANIELIRQIGNISNNLNQAVRMAHIANNADPNEIDLVCLELLNYVRKIRNELLGVQL